MCAAHLIFYNRKSDTRSTAYAYETVQINGRKTDDTILKSMLIGSTLGCGSNSGILLNIVHKVKTPGAVYGTLGSKRVGKNEQKD